MGLLDKLKDRTRKASAPETPKPVDLSVPEGVLLSELWRDPNESGGLAAMLPWVQIGFLFIILIRVFMH